LKGNACVNEILGRGEKSTPEVHAGGCEGLGLVTGVEAKGRPGLERLGRWRATKTGRPERFPTPSQNSCLWSRTTGRSPVCSPRPAYRYWDCPSRPEVHRPMPGRKSTKHSNLPVLPRPSLARGAAYGLLLRDPLLRMPPFRKSPLPTPLCRCASGSALARLQSLLGTTITSEPLFHTAKPERHAAADRRAQLPSHRPGIDLYGPGQHMGR
jgi:hypothetical protein